ncbi:MAG: dihydroorotate dehydrogenase electron transfer subunit [Thaumarchaeota archaeon]|nr:dihydroorotate dehydrogenase electron transfer subunit [Nitrososphaerota archaeon]
MSVFLTPSDRLRIVRVEESRVETQTARTVFFRDEACLNAKPGQFAMIWAMGADEMPMSLSVMNDEGRSAVTVKPWGPGSNLLCSLKPGELIGVRGPYGNNFTSKKGSTLLVGGGSGVAPLIPLSQELMRIGAKVTLVLAGKTSGDLMLLGDAERIIKPPHRLVIVTDDGSAGVKGLAPDAVRDLLSKKAFDQIYSCGPEKMMRMVFDMAEEKGIPMEASLERPMECAIGLCGICVVGKYLLCRDGPVLDSKQLREVSKEFGFTRLDRAGRVVPL